MLQMAEEWAELSEGFKDLERMTLEDFQHLKPAEVDDFVKSVGSLASKGKFRRLYALGKGPRDCVWLGVCGWVVAEKSGPNIIYLISRYP